LLRVERPIPEPGRHDGSCLAEANRGKAVILRQCIQENLCVLRARLECGARVVIEAIGPDEHEALDELEASLLRLRDEEPEPG